MSIERMLVVQLTFSDSWIDSANAFLNVFHIKMDKELNSYSEKNSYVKEEQFEKKSLNIEVWNYI